VRKLVSAVLALVLCGFSGHALAQATHPGPLGVTQEPQRRETGAPSEESRSWYGDQVLISDAVTVSMLGAGLGLALSDNKAGHSAAATMIPIGALGYALVPATIHWFHGRFTIGLASISVRVGAPVLGLLIGAQFNCPLPPDGSEHQCESGSDLAPTLGLFAGLAFASLLDAAAFSYDDPSAERSQSAKFGLAPFLSADGKRAELRAYGTF